MNRIWTSSGVPRTRETYSDATALMYGLRLSRPSAPSRARTVARTIERRHTTIVIPAPCTMNGDARAMKPGSTRPAYHSAAPIPRTSSAQTSANLSR
jgi:hypothetical protein